MKIKAQYAKYPLTAASIDEIAHKVEVFLRSIDTERANILRARLSLEEALLRWQDRFGEEAVVVFATGTRWRRPVISLELAGEQFNPMEPADDGLEIWSKKIMAEVGMTPQYSYQRGTNVLQLRLHHPRRNPSLNLLIAMAVGLGAGLLGRVIFPLSVQDSIIRTTLEPIQSLFFRMLNAASGPIIFFTVLVSICSVGGVAGSGKAGRKMLGRFFFVSSILTALALTVSSLAFSLHYYTSPMTDTRFASVLDFFLQFIPNDVLTPFMTGGTHQVVLIAIILGNALLVVSNQSETLMSLIEQINNVGLIIADWVGKLTPYFVVFLLITGLWKRSLRSFLDCWQPMLLFLLLMAGAVLACMLQVSVTKKVSLRKLRRKLAPSFLVAMRTASVDAAYGDNVFCCEKRLGISPNVTAYGLPLGLVIFMPAGSMATIIFTMYAAKTYGIVISWVWCVTALVLTVALVAASPPVVGIGLLAYAAIFARLGIPTDGLTIALLADVLFSFVTAAGNQAMLQLELVLQADRLGALNRDILQK